MEIVDHMQEQMDTVRGKMEMLRKNEKEMPETQDAKRNEAH